MRPPPPRLPPRHHLLELLHPVEGGAGLEPLDLCLVEGVVQRDGLLAAVAVLDHRGHGLGAGTQEASVRHVSIICQVFLRHNIMRGWTVLWINVVISVDIAHLAGGKGIQAGD